MEYLLYVLLAVLAVLVVLLLIAAIRAVAVKAKPLPPEKVGDSDSAAAAKYAEGLAKMVRCPTVSLHKGDDPQRFYDLQEEMSKIFPLIFSKLEKVDLDGNMLFRWPGKDPSLDGLLLMGHQDVVPADAGEWLHPPFDGVIENGKIHGRGSFDCKCTVAAEFFAVEELLAEGFVPPRDIYLSSSVDEEISGTGAKKAVAYLKSQNVRLAAVLDEGGAVMLDALPGLKGYCAAIGIVEKGYMDVKVIARGSGGHASTPPKDTPIVRLSKFVAEVEKEQPFKKELAEPVAAMFSAIAPYLGFPLRLVFSNLWLFKPLLTRLMPLVSPMGGAFVATTCAFTMSGGSSAANVLPDEAFVTCNLRPSIHQDSDTSLAILKKYIDKYDLEYELGVKRDASNVTDHKGAEFAYAADCAKKCFPDACVTPYYMTGGTDCRTYEAVSDNCLRFCPLRIDGEQLKAMHAANENINVSALAESVNYYKYYLKNHS